MNYAWQLEKANEPGDSGDRVGGGWVIAHPDLSSPHSQACGALSLHTPFSFPGAISNYKSYFRLWFQPQMFNKANSSPVVIREKMLALSLTSTLPHTRRLPQATDLSGQCSCSHSPGHVAGALCWGQPLWRKEKGLFPSLEKHFGVWPEACLPSLQDLLLCFQDIWNLKRREECQVVWEV